jgi:hypothetical protein
MPDSAEKKPGFTAGPWRVAEDSYGGFNRIWSAEGEDVATCTGDGAIPKAEREANERLISAAPEMYLALLSVLGATDHNQLEKAIAKARSALQKAEGR